MLKKLVALLGVSCLSVLLLTACGGTSNGPNPVHMSDTQFAQSSITINKGESITLIKDSNFVSHTIADGAWKNGTAKAAQETGAPAINNVQVGAASSTTVGPFANAGTFTLYCTVHPGMNLTVVLQ